jgi:hypothetical protein
MTDTPAEVHIVVAHAVPGFNALPTPTVSLLSESNSSVRLTVEPDELFTRRSFMRQDGLTPCRHST